MKETLEALYQQLLSMPFGNRFSQGDLHVHTPMSFDFRDRSRHTVQEVLQAALDKGLDFVALTDHNSADGYAEVYSEIAARKWPLTVFPGVEITCPGGRNGIHLLALFEPGTRVDVLNEMLFSVGIDHTKRGRKDTIAEESLIRILERIERMGGIAIAAHVNGPNGILGGLSSANQRRPLLTSGRLHALEITGPSEMVSVKNQVGNTIALVQGSDAHTPGDVGKRSCRIKMNRPSLEGLKAAFAEPELRLGQDDSAYKVVMEGLVIEGGFFSLDGDDLRIRFHESFNCLVGGRGAGKSTIIEVMKGTLLADTDVLDHYGVSRSILFVRIDGNHYALELGDSARREWIRKENGKWRLTTLHTETLAAIHSQGAFYDQAKRSSLLEIIDLVVSDSSKVKAAKRDYASIRRSVLDTNCRPHRDSYLVEFLLNSEHLLEKHLDLSEDEYDEAHLDSSFVVDLVGMEYEFQKWNVPPESFKPVIGSAYSLTEEEVQSRGGYSDIPIQISKELYTRFLETHDAKEMLAGLREIRAYLELLDAPLLVEGHFAQIWTDVLELLILEDNLFALRQSSVDTLNARCGGSLLIKLNKSVSSAAYLEFLLMLGLDRETAQGVQKSLDPRQLMRALINKNGVPKEIARTANDVLLRMLTAHGISEWLKCWRTHPLVQLRGMANFQNLDRLSVGQQCTVLLNLALVSGDTSLPLVIDQPEDHLDNLSINQSLVSTVRSARQQRQIVFATHNANLAVLGDTDLFSVLGQKDQGGALICSGSLEDASVRALVVQVLEGGDQALQARLTKYGE